MRKLASIQTILNIEPIKDADKIEVATVLGWHIVVKKEDGFKVGDKVVYIETDSVLPSDDERFSFLASCNYRIKTIKLRGQVSQGLVLPISVLPEGNYEIGDDVSEILRITKYEAPIPAELGTSVCGGYSANVPKADETRVQTLQDIITRYKGVKFYRTEKVDGTSSAFTLENGEYNVLGHNWAYNFDENNVYWKMSIKYDLENVLRDIGRNLSFKGEIIGPGIQKNKYKLNDGEYRLYIFDIWDIDNQRYLDLDEVIEITNKYNLLMVPIIERDVELIDDIDTLVEMSKGMSVVNPSIKREGNVWRPMHEINDDKDMHRISFKVINPDFLLKFSE